MTAKLEGDFKRELSIGRRPYTLTISRVGFTLAQEGKRKRLNIKWADLVTARPRSPLDRRFASRDLIDSFQSLSRSLRQPGDVNVPRNWMGNFCEKLFCDASQGLGAQMLRLNRPHFG